MAVTKAEDDDDEGFGDFKFAYFPNYTVHSDQLKGRDSATAHINSDDDEWGDFIEYPLRSELPNGLSKPPNPSQPSKPFDPFGFLPDHSMKPSQYVETRIESVPSVVESGKGQWMKPKGALPLSFFGDMEEEKEEQQSVVVDPPVGDAKDSFADKRATGNAKNGSNITVGVGINDLIANLYNRSLQIKAENGLNSNGVNELNMNGSALNLNGLNSNSGSVRENRDLDMLTNLNNLSPRVKTEDEFNFNSNGSDSNFNSSSSNISGLNSNLDSVGAEEGFDADDEGWEFKDAYSGSNSGSKGGAWNDKVQEISEVTANSSGFVSGSHRSVGLFSTSNGSPSKSHEMENEFDFEPSVQEISEATAYSFGVGSGSHGSIDLFASSNGSSSKSHEMKNDFDFKPSVQEIPEVTAYSSGFGSGLYGSIDLFAASNGSYSKSHKMENEFDFKLSAATQNGFISDSYFKNDLNDTENRLDSHTNIVANADSDETFGVFKAAFSESESKQEDPKINGLSHSEVEVLTSDGKAQGNETRSENHKGALPLSIFGDEELETDGSLNTQDVFMFRPASYPRNTQTQGSNISIKDLISNLYSQAGEIPSVESMQKPTEDGLNSNSTVSNSNLADDDDNDDDDFDDSSWEFKDALLETTAKDQMSVPCVGDSHQNFSIKLKINNYADFYSKLEDELRVLARWHLDSLKKARTAAALSGDDAKVAAFDEEIQEACKELHQEGMISEEAYSEHCPPIDIYLNEFLEVLREPEFQLLELEYGLSSKLSSAEKDLRSTIQLMKHAKTMLKILRLGSLEEQFNYVSAWSQMISVCAQELKHGAWIWKQSLEKNVGSRMLTESQGKRYILALGEIYRVVMVLETSTKLYKPWMPSSSVDSAGLYSLLEECHNLWSSSGFEEALPSISDPIGFEYNGTSKALLESIKYIRHLDPLSLGNNVFTQQESICRLSGLTPGVLPDMKMVIWNGEHYFLALANLWANLISCDPPKLPHLHVG